VGVLTPTVGPAYDSRASSGKTRRPIRCPLCAVPAVSRDDRYSLSRPPTPPSRRWWDDRHQPAAREDDEHRDAHPLVSKVLTLYDRLGDRQQVGGDQVDDEQAGSDPHGEVQVVWKPEHERREPRQQPAGKRQHWEEDEPDRDRAADLQPLLLELDGVLMARDRPLERLARPSTRGRRPADQSSEGLIDAEREVSQSRDEQRIDEEPNYYTRAVIQDRGDHVQRCLLGAAVV